MELERFERIARNPSRTREELENMKSNAIANGKVEHARIAAEVLLERFPVHTKQGAGRTPTRAAFRGRAEHFESGKEAYLWLVEQFVSHVPDILSRYQTLHARARSGGRRFAQSADELFPPGSKRAGNPAYYARLHSGWYAETNVNHQDKFEALVQLGYLAKLEYPSQWSFEVEGATKQLAERQALVIRARELLAQLLRE